MPVGIVSVVAGAEALNSQTHADTMNAWVYYYTNNLGGLYNEESNS
jgi:hypothetical protein